MTGLLSSAPAAPEMLRLHIVLRAGPLHRGCDKMPARRRGRSVAWGDALGWRVFYRVVVAPLETAQQAAQVCDNLKVQGVARFIRAI